MKIGSEMSEAGLVLVRQYAAGERSFEEKISMFNDVISLMKKYQSKTSPEDFGYSEEMYAVIKATPPEILSLRSSSGVENFSHPIKLFEEYVELSLKELAFGIEIQWENFNEETRKNICSSMYTAFEAVGEVLILRQKIVHSQLTLDASLSKYSEEIVNCCEEFERKINYSGKLIEDELSNAVDLRKHIRRIANSSEKTSKKIMQDVQAFKDFLESVIPGKDAKRFETTADNHKFRAHLSIGIALLLGAMGLAWGVFLSGQDLQKGCGEYWFCILLNIGVRGFLLATGILVIGIYASVRSYFAHSQSEANNRQRFNALESYENMIKLVSNLSVPPEAKKFITEKAVECIYSHQPTGFVKEQKDSDAKTTLVLPQISTPSTSDPQGR